MITLNITPNGEITISQETADERRALYGHFDDRDQDVKEDGSETAQDEKNESFFKQGWQMATQEAMNNFVRGRMVEYFQEIGMAGPLNEAGNALKSEDPHAAEPEGTGEAVVDLESDQHIFDDVPAAGWAGRDEVVERIERPEYPEDEDPTPVIAVVAEDPEIRPVVDSGEPLKEASIGAETTDGGGTWTMSNDELQSRLDASYTRGREDADKTKPITTKAALNIVGIEINAEVLKKWDEERLEEQIDEGPIPPISKGEYAKRFANVLAVRLGWDVAS